MEFDRSPVVLLFRANTAADLSAERAAALQDAHLDHLARLRDNGQLIAAGPLGEGPDETLRGISVSAAGRETAARLAADDPAVHGGLFASTRSPGTSPVVR